MTFAGPTADRDKYPQGQRGGLRNLPYCGILRGFKLSLRSGANATPTSTSLGIDITAGAAKFDGVPVALDSNITTGGTTVPQLVPGTTNVRDIYFSPTRKVPAVLTAPTSGGNDGDMQIHVADMGDYFLYLNTYRRVSGSWVVYDPKYEPPSQNHLALPLNDILPTVTISNFSGIPEKSIYKNPAITKSSPNQGLVLIREGLGLKVATVTLVLPSTYTFGTTAPTSATIINHDNAIAI